MRLLTAGSLVRVQQGEPKKALAFASAFFNEINPFRDLWNALRAWNTPTACEIAAAVRIYFISLDAKHQISQFVEQIISPWAKRTISLFVWTKRFEYWARSVSRLGAPRCLRQMKRCSEQEETTSIAKRSKRARRLCFWPTGSLISIHLRCMKNEVASLMKCGQTAWKLKARFTSCEHSEHFITTKLSLHVCGANTSFV